MNEVYKILSQVQNPFTDEKLKELIELYIQSNCDMNKFYNRVNRTEDMNRSPYLSELYNYLIKEDICLNVNEYWNIVSSEEEFLKKSNNMRPIYRIYINAKEMNKVNIVKSYIEGCKAENRGYKFKYSNTDGRKDEIVILSSEEDFVKNIELIETITEGMDLGTPPELAGVYKEKIGIGEEYIQVPIYSYTQIRLGMIPIAMQKYILDNFSDFEKYCDDSEKSIVKYLIDDFKDEAEDISEELEEISESNEKKKRKLEEELFAYKNNIEPNGFMQMFDSVCKYFPEKLSEFIGEHSDIAFSEIVKNYRLSCEIFGISENGLFSQITENDILKKHNKTKLELKEEELQFLEEESKNLDEKLMGIQNENEGTELGE